MYQKHSEVPVPNNFMFNTPKALILVQIHGRKECGLLSHDTSKNIAGSSNSTSESGLTTARATN